MSIDSVPYLKSFHAHSVWGKYKFDVEFTDGINFISGLNGSGKSTLVKMIYVQLSHYCGSQFLTPFCGLFSYSNEQSILYGNLPLIGSTGESLVHEDLEKEGIVLDGKLKPIERLYSGTWSPENYKRWLGVSPVKQSRLHSVNASNSSNLVVEHVNSELHEVDISVMNLPAISVYSPEFHNLITQSAMNNKFDLKVTNEVGEKTQLQNLISLFQSYEYQLLEQFFENPNLDQNEILKERNEFQSLVNDFFHEVGKELVRNDDKKLAFKILSTEEIIEVDTLSHGEQSLLYMLLLVFLHRDSVRIFLFDEPETALHLTWQRKLPEAFEQLAPNSQFIITTHSPGIVHGKWLSKMIDMKNIRSMMADSSVEG